MKKAIVTGGSRGIGRAVVQRLAQDGYEVLFTYRTNDAAARDLEQLGRAQGWVVHGERFDQSSQQDHARLKQHVAASGETSRVHALVINAGIAIHHPISEVNEDDFDRVFATNLRGPLF